MLIGSTSKMRLKELEETCEQLNDIVEKQNIQLETKDKQIKHLTANARNWSKKFHADPANEETSEMSISDFPPQAVESSLEAKEELLQAHADLADAESGKNQSRLLLQQVSAANVKLVEKLKVLEAEAITAKSIQTRLEKKLESVPPEQQIQEAAVAEDKNNNASEAVVLEFSPEMQITLAKYAKKSITEPQ